MCRWWHVIQRRDVRRTERLKMLCPGIEVVDHEADMMEATIFQANAGLIFGKLQNGNAEVAIGHDNARRARCNVRIARVEAISSNFLKPESSLEKLRGLAGMIARNCNVSNLSHPSILSLDCFLVRPITAQVWFRPQSRSLISGCVVPRSLRRTRQACYRLQSALQLPSVG